MAAENLEQKIKHLEEAIKSSQHEIERLQAVVEIQNLMSKHEYLHTADQQKELMELYSKNAPDASVCIQNVGTWKGKDAGKRAWGHLDVAPKEDRIGTMAIHPVTTFVIEVAKDGKTAKGVWLGNGMVASPDKETGNPQAMWEWDRCGVDFIKEDGKWKIWHYHIYRIFRVGWDDKWASQFDEIEKPIREHHFPDALKPDGPATDDYPYLPTTQFQYVPVPPEPYETWDEKTAYH